MYTTVIGALPGDPRLETALASIFDQTLAPTCVEVITDAVHNIPQGWTEGLQAQFKNLKFHTQSDSGYPAAIRAGIVRAKTNYVAFLDCDDVWLPEKQALQINALESDLEVDVATGLAANVIQESSGDSRTLRVGVASLFTASTFRRDTFDRFGLPDSDAGHYGWLYRWWANARSMGIRTHEVQYVGLERHIHGDNSWITGSQQAHENLFRELRQIVHSKRKTSE